MLFTLRPSLQLLFLQRPWEEIEEELMALREREIERVNNVDTKGVTLRARVISLEVVETWLHGIVKDERKARERIERPLGLV
ncbi:hypothetical protein Tco_1296466 [Tanacetum coccineum]